MKTYGGAGVWAAGSDVGAASLLDWDSDDRNAEAVEASDELSVAVTVGGAAGEVLAVAADVGLSTLLVARDKLGGSRDHGGGEEDGGNGGELHFEGVGWFLRLSEELEVLRVVELIGLDDCVVMMRRRIGGNTSSYLSSVGCAWRSAKSNKLHDSSNLSMEPNGRLSIY